LPPPLLSSFFVSSFLLPNSFTPFYNPILNYVMVSRVLWKRREGDSSESPIVSPSDFLCFFFFPVRVLNGEVEQDGCPVFWTLSLAIPRESCRFSHFLPRFHPDLPPAFPLLYFCLSPALVTRPDRPGFPSARNVPFYLLGSAFFFPFLAFLVFFQI